MVPIKLGVRVECPTCQWTGYRRDLITSEKLEHPEQIASSRPCPHCRGRVRVRYMIFPRSDDEETGSA